MPDFVQKLIGKIGALAVNAEAVFAFWIPHQRHLQYIVETKVN
jgi:hypothetical protein